MLNTRQFAPFPRFDAADPIDFMTLPSNAWLAEMPTAAEMPAMNAPTEPSTAELWTKFKEATRAIEEATLTIANASEQIRYVLALLQAKQANG